MPLIIVLAPFLMIIRAIALLVIIMFFGTLAFLVNLGTEYPKPLSKCRLFVCKILVTIMGRILLFI
jgi:hypothetical protein